MLSHMSVLLVHQKGHKHISYLNWFLILTHCDLTSIAPYLVFQNEQEDR